jgi:hypothetical protein
MRGKSNTIQPQHLTPFETPMGGNVYAGLVDFLASDGHSFDTAFSRIRKK